MHILITTFNGTNFNRIKINCSAWYNLANECTSNGVIPEEIMKIDRIIDNDEIDDRT